MTTPTPSPSSQPSLRRDRSGCGGGGDGCVAPPETWPLHNVRQRGVLLRLCTSCVLKNNPGLFCSACFLFLDGFGSTSTSTTAPVVHCSSCPSLCHRSCLLPIHESGRFLCPICENRDGFSYFSKKEIDVDASKVLLVAARISAASMGKAVAAARSEAERKVREAVSAKKRAREMLERAAFVAKVERERKKAKISAEAKLPESKVEEKKATATMMAEKRLQNREREKLMKFQPFQGVISTAPLGNSAKNGLLSVDRKKISLADEKKDRILDCTNTNAAAAAAAAAAVKSQQLPPNTIS